MNAVYLLLALFFAVALGRKNMAIAGDRYGWGYHRDSGQPADFERENDRGTLCEGKGIWGYAGNPCAGGHGIRHGGQPKPLGGQPSAPDWTDSQREYRGESACRDLADGYMAGDMMRS